MKCDDDDDVDDYDDSHLDQARRSIKQWEEMVGGLSGREEGSFRCLHSK